MTGAQYLDQAIANVQAALASMTANPQPNYSIDGQSVSRESLWNTYVQRLLDLEKARQRADGPFEIRSFGSP